MKYNIKQTIVTKPVVELPEGSIAVSVKHHDGYRFSFEAGTDVPGCWQVIYLEPIK